MSGLYSSLVPFTASASSPSTGSLSPVIVVPTDLEVVGLVAHVGTAPGGSDALTINVQDSPTSQLAEVSAYNLWTVANVPTIEGSAVNSFNITTAPTVIINHPYALDYPLPGPEGTTGYETAQSTSLTTNDFVSSPPSIHQYQMEELVAPDNTYVDFNGVTQPANIVRAGDILTFVIGGVVGSAADLSITLFCQQN